MQYKWVALSVTTVGTLMAGLDGRIIIVGLPTVARQLGADAEQVIWVSQAYLLASTIGLLLIGRVTDVIGRVKIYNIGFIIFTIGSALASISLSPEQLIASRLVQGTGSAMLITNSAAILTDAAPREELGTILGLNQIAFRIGSISGLTLSGVVIALAGWRALFYLNIPIGIFGTMWAYLRLREISTRDTARKMDWPGFGTFTTGLTLLLVSITFFSYGPTDYLQASLMVVSGAVLILLFIRIEMKTQVPILDLNLFRIKEFAAGNIAQMLNSFAWTGITVMLSFFLQIVLNESPLQTGLSLLPIEATYIVFGPLSGRLSDRYGTRLFSTLGLAISSAGFFWLAFSNIHTNVSQLIIPLALLGVGNGMFVSPNISSIMGSVPAKRRGIASGFRVTSLNIGLTASSGLAILLITTGIPYALFTQLLQGHVATTLARVEFVNGFRIATIVLAAMNTVAIVPSMLRGKKTPESPELIEL
ncbi:MAG: MFS transporter [Nitrososphaerales archaeon]